jgi:hypothetical protein
VQADSNLSISRKKSSTQVPISRVSVNDGVIDAVIEIGRQRAEILEAMKEALVRGDEVEALERARELTGLPSRAPKEVPIVK